ncbi:MAG TPA: hypothetical protein VK826_14380 [Bacteroidia bacterium]|nr:hypothetical protein [Bacteroidia bacterium]
MKNLIFSACIACTLSLASCMGNSGMSDEAKRYADSALMADSLAALPYVENVLELNSEADLIRKYGEGSVSYDTIWGAEGFFTMGTYLITDEYSRIEILWSDSASRKGLISATLVSNMDYYAETLDPGTWKSRTGVSLGMSTDDLQKLNGRPFKFSGFGWDYGGGVMSWENGTLDKKGIAVQLSEGTSAELSQDETNQVLGDVPVMSNNPALQKLKPRVWSISVAKVN